MMEVARNDRYCRRLELSLYANGKPFEPTDCRVLIRYRREDGAFGEYDTMPDGVTAWEISGNTVTILLHPDVTESAEKAELEVQLLRGNTRLCMFPVDVRVRGIGKQRQPARKAEDVTGFLPQPAVARQDEFILAEKVDERGQVLQTRTAKLEMDPEKTKDMIQQTVMEYLEEHPVQGGTSGEDGKSAYAYAQEAGYTGTEEEFAQKLAEEALIAVTYDITPAQVAEAVTNGRNVILTHIDAKYGPIAFNNFIYIPALGAVISSAIVYFAGDYLVIELVGDTRDGSWTALSEEVATANDIPVPVIGTTEEITPSQVAEAIEAGQDVSVTHNHAIYGAVVFSSFMRAHSFNCVASSEILHYDGAYILIELVGNTIRNDWALLVTQLAQYSDIPESLKNPYALTIDGVSYDGSQAVNIESIKGDTGQRGTGLLPVTAAPVSYTNAVGGITPKYRMSISTIKTQAGVTEVLLGDTVRYSYYHYPIAYLDGSYAYFTTRVSIRGAAGAAGEAGYTPVRGTDYWTDADKQEITDLINSSVDEKLNTLTRAEEVAF